MSYYSSSRWYVFDSRWVNWDLSLASHNMCASSLFLWGHRSQSLCSVYVRGPWYFLTRLLHFNSSKSNRNKARSMPRQLWVTNTKFGGRLAEAAVAVNFVHKGIPRQKSPDNMGKCRGGGGRGVVSDRAHNIWWFFNFQVREKECLALQTTYKTQLRIPRRSV